VGSALSPVWTLKKTHDRVKAPATLPNADYVAFDGVRLPSSTRTLTVRS
jgi:hypothetical protein